MSAPCACFIGRLSLLRIRGHSNTIMVVRVYIQTPRSLPSASRADARSRFLSRKRGTESGRPGRSTFPRRPTFPRARRTAVTRVRERARERNSARTTVEGVRGENRANRTRRAGKRTRYPLGTARSHRHRIASRARADLGDDTRGVGHRCESGASARGT